MNFYDLLQYREREETRIARHGEASGPGPGPRSPQGGSRSAVDRGCCAASGRLSLVLTLVSRDCVCVHIGDSHGSGTPAPHPCSARGCSQAKEGLWLAGPLCPRPTAGLSWTGVRPPRPSPSRTVHSAECGEVCAERHAGALSAGLQALCSAADTGSCLVCGHCAFRFSVKDQN